MHFDQPIFYISHAHHPKMKLTSVLIALAAPILTMAKLTRDYLPKVIGMDCIPMREGLRRCGESFQLVLCVLPTTFPLTYLLLLLPKSSLPPNANAISSFK